MNEIDNGHDVKPSNPDVKKACDFVAERFNLSTLDKYGLYAVIVKYLWGILGKSYENK